MALAAKRLTANAGDVRDAISIPGSGRSRDGYGNALQYSCLENPMDRGAWWATAQRAAKSRTRLSDLARAHANAQLAKLSAYALQHVASQAPFLQKEFLFPSKKCLRIFATCPQHNATNRHQNTLSDHLCIKHRQEQGNLLRRSSINLRFRHPKRKEKKVTYRSIYFFKDESSWEGTNGYL